MHERFALSICCMHLCGPLSLSLWLHHFQFLIFLWNIHSMPRGIKFVHIFQWTFVLHGNNVKETNFMESLMLTALDKNVLWKNTAISMHKTQIMCFVHQWMFTAFCSLDAFCQSVPFNPNTWHSISSSHWTRLQILHGLYV